MSRTRILGPRLLQPPTQSSTTFGTSPKIDWHEPFAKKLQDVKDIYEIRFKAEKVQHRPLGCFGPGTNEFTVLIWASKKQNIYDPSGAINTADNRRKEIAGGQASCAPLTVDGEEFPPA